MERKVSFRYWIIFGILAIFTGLEVIVASLPGLPQGIKVGVLVFLAVVKAVLVLLYFMHLRFDNRLYALPFALGIVLLVPLLLIVGLTINNPPVRAEAKGLTASGQVIDVREVSFRIHLSQDHANAGKVTFHIVNGADDMLHEFIIFKTDLSPDELPTDPMTGAVNEDALTIIKAEEDIPPSNSRDITVSLAAGHYVMICNLPGHYQQGMRVEFAVTGTSSEPPSTPESPAQPTQSPPGSPDKTPTAGS
jgi:caa(3)-type oxidase subunit IV